MNYLYKYETKLGLFYIVEHNGKFSPYFDNENLGNYGSALLAVGDLSGGSCIVPSGIELDLAELEIPEDLAEWEKIN